MQTKVAAWNDEARLLVLSGAAAVCLYGVLAGFGFPSVIGSTGGLGLSEPFIRVPGGTVTPRHDPAPRTRSTQRVTSPRVAPHRRAFIKALTAADHRRISPPGRGEPATPSRTSPATESAPAVATQPQPSVPTSTLPAPPPPIALPELSPLPQLPQLPQPPQVPLVQLPGQ